MLGEDPVFKGCVYRELSGGVVHDGGDVPQSGALVVLYSGVSCCSRVLECFWRRTERPAKEGTRTLSRGTTCSQHTKRTTSHVRDVA